MPPWVGPGKSKSLMDILIDPLYQARYGMTGPQKVAVADSRVLPGAPDPNTDPDAADRFTSAYLFTNRFGGAAPTAINTIYGGVGDPSASAGLAGTRAASQGAVAGEYMPGTEAPAPQTIDLPPSTYLPPTRGGASVYSDPVATLPIDPRFRTTDPNNPANSPLQNELPVDPRFAPSNPNNPFNQTLSATPTISQPPTHIDSSTFAPGPAAPSAAARTYRQAGMGSNAAGQEVDAGAARDQAYQQAVNDVLGDGAGGSSGDSASDMLGFRNPGGNRGGAGRGGTVAGAGPVPATTPMQGGGTGRTAPIANAGAPAPVTMQGASQQYSPGSLGDILASSGRKIFTGRSW